MKTYKYYIEVISECGQVIFKSRSNDMKALVKRYNKAAHSSDGNMYSSFYFGKLNTNLTYEDFYNAGF